MNHQKKIDLKKHYQKKIILKLLKKNNRKLFFKNNKQKFKKKSKKNFSNKKVFKTKSYRLKIINALKQFLNNKKK